MNMLSVIDAAAKKGVTRDAMLKAVNAGKINAQKVGRSFVVFDDKKFEAYEPGKQGRPPLLMCTDETCKRKVVQIEDGRYQCISCKKVYDESEIQAREA